MVEEIEEKKIRQYLLGELAEAEMSQFEERLMTNDELFEMLLVVEDELIDERAANELSAEDQARFDNYFLATPQRRERLQLAQALHVYAARHADEPNPAANPESGATSDPANATPSANASKRVVVDFPSAEKETRSSRWLSARPYLSLAAAAAVLIAVGLGAWRIYFYQSDVSKGLQALNHAYRNHPPIEARMTKLDYPPLSTMRGEVESDKGDPLERELAERLLLQAVKEHPNSESYHAAGCLYLAKRQFNDAITQFKKALQLDMNNAQLYNDLGAAYLEKGKAAERDKPGEGHEDFAHSLENLSSALELNKALLEARFNRALLYQSLMEPREAREEWRKYLEQDPNSRWAEEARQKLRSLEE